MGRQWSINNCINSNNPIIRFTFNNHIDRIRISIRNRYNLYKQVKALFTKEFGLPKITKPNKHTIENAYSYEGKKIQIVYYLSCPHYFSVVIHDADQERQILIRDMLLSVVGTASCIYLSQVEFTWDFYPNDPAEIMPMWEAITQHIYFKKSRIGGFEYKETTYYQGKHGNARAGSKGLRFYPKQNSTGEFLRVEVQANHYTIKRDLNLNILSLPIEPSMVRFGRYLEFRRWYDQRGICQIAREIDEAEQRKTGASKLPRNPRSLAHAVGQELITRRLSGECNMKGKGIWGESSVAQQISGFKELKRKGRTTYPLEHFFPKLPLLLRMRSAGPKTGYMRVPS